MRRSGPLSPAAYAHYLRGRLAMETADYAGAALQFRAAVAAAPYEAEIRVALIEALVANKELAAAHEASVRAQKRFADYAGVWLASGRVYVAQRRLHDATRALERAIDNDELGEDAYLLLAEVWKKRGMPGNAARAYRRLLKQQPTSVRGNYRLGALLLKRRAYAAAEVPLRRALADKPDHVDAWIALVRAQRRRGRTASALRTVQRAFDRSGADATVADYLFRHLLATEPRSFAVRTIAAIDRDDLNPDTRVSLGYLLIHAGVARTALRLADAVVRQSARGSAAILRAAALRALQRSGEALKVLLAVSPDDPSYADARADAVEMLARQGATARAGTVADAALKLHPRHADLIASRALAFELGGNIKAARATFTTALAAQAKNADLRLAFAAFEDRQHRYRTAIRLAEPILDDDPQDTRVLNFIGYSLAERGVQLHRAERLLRKAMKLAPLDGYILDSYGWLLFRKRRLDAAERALSRAVRLAPAEPEILWHLAEIYLHHKQRRKALQLLSRAQALNPQGKVKQRIEARIRALGSD